MNYKEIHQEIYETLTESLGREADWKEIDEAFRDRMSNLVACYQE